MRTLFTIALLSAIAFSGVAVGQEETNQVVEIAGEATETLNETLTSVVDLGLAPSDAEIDTARIENGTTVLDGGIATVTAAYNQSIDQGVSYPENVVIQDCGCQSGMIAPVVYQSPLIEGVVESAGEMAVDGAIESVPVADAASVVESPITDSAAVYADAGMVTEGTPVVVEGDPIVAGTPGCGCNQAAAPTEGLISSPIISYESAPVTYSSPAPAAAPCCTPAPARRGFFRTLLGR